MKSVVGKFFVYLTLLFLVRPLFAESPQQSPQTTSATVTKITDGDTIHVISDGQLMKIRLAFIDCPEKKQAQGLEAKFELSSLISDEVITLHIYDVDRYGRQVAEVFHNGDSINLLLVKNGFCYVYPKYAKGKQDFYAAEAYAVNLRLGVHAYPDSVKPWVWRRKK
jgi:micrococcal nuclease